MRNVAAELIPWLEKSNRFLARQAEEGFILTPDIARRGLAALTRSLVTTIPAIALSCDSDLKTSGGTLPLRVYHPNPGHALPVLVFFHGGGHMCGSVEVYDPICRKLALASDHLVVAMDYRLAPEAPYPAGLDDGWQVLQSVYQVLDSLALAYRPVLSIAGDSGGGAMCATLGLRAAAESLDLSAQVLIYPSLDYSMSLPSVSLNGEGFMLEVQRMIWYFDHYFPRGTDRIKASPLHQRIPENLAPTLVLTAEFCPLRDEGQAFVMKLKDAGVVADNMHFNDMIHAFLNMEDLCLRACDSAYQRIGEFLKTHEP